MDEEKNYSISGVSTISEGEYGNIEISGVGKLIGNIKAEKIEVSGLGKSKADIICKEINIAGNFKSEGKCKSNKIINISGVGKFADVDTQKLMITGMATVQGKLLTDKASIIGSINVEGNFEGREVDIEGLAKVKGLLTADKINIDLKGKCHVNEIGGEEIKVGVSKYKSRNVFMGFSFTRKSELISKIIEGDNIYLENTHCSVVRGKNITISKGCEIDTIEYTNTINIDDRSKVRNIVNLGEEK